MFAPTTTEAAPAVTGTSARRELSPHWHKVSLVLGLAFVLGCRALLFFWDPDRATDFDALYNTAVRLIHGQNPYPPGMQWFPYPLPAVLLVVPFSLIPLTFARPIFDVLVGWAFVYALWQHRGTYAVLAIFSGPYLFAMLNGQTTPLMVAASLVPALGFLLAIRPNTSGPLWVARSTWTALLGAGAVILFSIVILPSWPRDWWMALPPDYHQLVPPIMRPLGFILLLAAFRWRSPRGRLLLATAFAPQSTLPYELVPMALVPTDRLEMCLYVISSWIPLVVADRMLITPGSPEWTTVGWQATLFAGYVPMLFLVLWRGQVSRKLPTFWKERRRPNRLSDKNLKIAVGTNPAGSFTVRITHSPTRLFAEETDRSQEAATRRAHDRLAALLAETSRLSQGGKVVNW